VTRRPIRLERAKITTGMPERLLSATSMSPMIVATSDPAYSLPDERDPELDQRAACQAAVRSL
jgi:hypothetical protein